MRQFIIELSEEKGDMYDTYFQHEYRPEYLDPEKYKDRLEVARLGNYLLHLKPQKRKPHETTVHR